MNCIIIIKMSKQWESHETRGAVLVDHHVPQDHNCIVGTCLNAHPCGNLCQAWFAALSSITIMQFYFNRNVIKSLLHDSINFYNRKCRVTFKARRNLLHVFHLGLHANAQLYFSNTMRTFLLCRSGGHVCRFRTFLAKAD